MTTEQHEIDWAHLLRRQEALEEQSMARGVKRFRRRLERAAQKEQLSTYGAAKRLLTGGLDALTESIVTFTEARGKGRANHCAIRWLRKIGEDKARITVKALNARREKQGKPRISDATVEAIMVKSLREGFEGAAYLTLKVILDGIEQDRTLYGVAKNIADLIMDELKYRRFRELAPKLYEYKLNSFNTSSYAYMSRSLTGSMKGLRCKACLDASREMTLSEKRANACPHMQEELADLTISPSHHLLLGTKLVDLAMQATGLITLRTEVTGRTRRATKRKLMVVPDPDTLAWLSKRNGIMELLSPVTLPMVVPPAPWGPGEQGGYRYALRGKFPLVRGASAETKAMLAETEMPTVYAALNAIQNTAWRVNTKVLAVLEALKARGGGLAGIPKQDLDEFPAKPANIGEKTREGEFARTAWKRAAHKVRENNKLRARDAMEYDRRLEIVQTMAGERAIFFPHTMDFRGRMYPVATTFTPQAEDLSRGLLEFAEGKPLGVEGSVWLAIHGANCLGEWQDRKVSKMTLQERVELVSGLGPRIYETAHDPLGDTWWATADDPVQFLAFCLEWGAWCDAGQDFAWVSHLPVSIDGTCNGLQHFGAMFRDEIGGAAVNLIPSETPSDIYERIAEHVKGQLEQDAPTNELAAQWLSSKLVKRKLTKRPTMTFGYGSKPFGFQAQLCEYVQGLGTSTEESKALYDAVKAHFSTEGADGEKEARIVQACGYLSTCIWKALIETVVAAFAGMSWMQTCARAIAKEGKPVTWTVPGTGFVVRQEYFKQHITQVETMLAGRMVKPALYTATDAVELHKQANAVAPNVVHSLDAAALMLTVVQAQAEGVEHFAAIHDSYGCLAGDMPILSRATRRCFVQLYAEHDVVGHLWQGWQEQTGTDLPEPPKAGVLDLGGVLASDYFFS